MVPNACSSPSLCRFGKSFIPNLTKKNILSKRTEKTNSNHSARTQDASMLSRKYTIIRHQICNLSRELLNSENYRAAHTESSRIFPNAGQNSCPHHQSKPSIQISLFFWKSPSLNRRSPTIFPYVLMRSICGEE